MKEKIIVFGTGTYYEKYKKELQSYKILAFLDNDVKKQGKILDGINIVPVKEGICLSFDYIILLSKYEDEMKEQLKCLGVPLSKIIEMEDFFKSRVYREYKVYTNSVCSTDYNALFVSNSLSLTGAPIVLMNAAKILMEAGYTPIFLSNTDGKLKDELLEMGITVVVEEHLEAFSYKLQCWLDQVELAFINTFVYYRALLNCNLSGKKVFWWLHEGENYYENIQANMEDQKKLQSLCILGVGSVACKSFQQVYGIQPYTLLYGIEEIKQTRDSGNKNDMITFAIIGSVIKRKGTDIFIRAIKLMDAELRRKAIFLIIGEHSGSDPALYDEILNIQKEIPQIIVTGEVDHREMPDLYQKIDVLVCPSRVDPMPVVVTEAMSQGKLCIVSNRVGTASYIDDGENGMIVPSENMEDLKKAMEFVIMNPVKCKKMGERSRKVYETYFSMESFRFNLMDIVNCLNKN